MEKNIEIVTIVNGEHKNIKITVEINYDRNTVSLVEKTNQGYLPKTFLFSGRTIAELYQWFVILETMKKAILHGKEKLILNDKSI